MRRFLFVLLVLVVFASACTGQSGSKTKVESKDLVEIKKLDIFPGTTIRPDDTVQIRLEVENVGQVPVIIEVGNKLTGDKVLYDYCPYIFKPAGEMQIFGAKEDVDDQHISLQSGRSIIFQWELLAPSAEKLLGLNTACNLGTKITYRADAKTTTYIYFASPSEISQKVYTGDDLGQKGDNIASHGPVVVNFETPPQPISSSTSTTQRNWTAFLNIKNVGKGIATIGQLNLSIPQDIHVAGTCKFDQSVTGLTIGDASPQDTKNLLKIGLQKTSRIPCTFNAPVVDILQPYKFESSAIYTYSVFKNTKVEVNTK